MRYQLALVFGFLALTAPQLAAQWGVELELAASRFSGTARDTSASGPATSGPSHPTMLALRVDRRAGSAGVGFGVLYASVGVLAEGPDFAVVSKHVLTFVELAPEVSWRFARTDSGAEFRVHLGPMADIWHPDGGTSRTLIGAHAALSLEWPIAGPVVGAVRTGAAVTGPVFERGDLPPGFERRATWRRWVALALRYRL
jgi:hypothetical protein